MRLINKPSKLHLGRSQLRWVENYRLIGLYVELKQNLFPWQQIGLSFTDTTYERLLAEHRVSSNLAESERLLIWELLNYTEEQWNLLHMQEVLGG